MYRVVQYKWPDSLTLTDDLVFYAGATQLGIALSSLFLPKILDWKGQTARLDELTRHVFWTYACYIFGTNLFFAGVAMVAPAAAR